MLQRYHYMYIQYLLTPIKIVIASDLALIETENV